MVPHPFKQQKHSPPSPPKLPIIGNLHQIGLQPHRSLRAIAQHHGPLMLLHFCSEPTLVSSANAAQEIVKTHDLIFVNRPKSSMFEKLSYNYKDVSLAPCGNEVVGLSEVVKGAGDDAWMREGLRGVAGSERTNGCMTGGSDAGMRDAFVGGTDTTYSVLEWAMAELLRHPRMMKKVQNEVRGITSQKKGTTEDQLEELQYLDAVTKETLRLHPISPLLLPRESNRDVQIQGYDIVVGTRVLINACAIGRDPGLWDNPEEYQPERFLNSTINFKGHDFQLIPFGAGRRGCPGICFAITTIKFSLVGQEERIWT
ncbi:hypothetical protein SO802_002812 [Lithocarpus litseifolius]|uniref:Cytochrome P450 n=1 Tax=Lithocarpus litseifolius TaxID=425828 RepID=A0AAW2E224_9ROSI